MLCRLGAQVLINMYNARSFLEDSTYLPWEERKNVRQALRGSVNALG